MSKKVFVGMSGGVDSSVAAMLLVDRGYDVTGVYMKNWSRDLPGMKCPWAEDLADAKRVAVRLGIDFEVWDFEKDYREKVVGYMLSEFKKGRTPNPDVMCNQEIKFKLFYEKARERGADFIATGHYARVADGRLMRAVDENKDQTYFLYRISEEALSHSLFPVGGMLKPEVKKLAEERGLHNAYKKESMGVCFVGEVGMKEFLQEYIDVRPGEIREVESGKVLGYHEGAVFYTLGQRHGLYLSGLKGEANEGLPYYVVSKDLEKNIVYVSRNLNDERIWTKELVLTDVVLRGEVANKAFGGRASGQGSSDEVSGGEVSSEVLVRLRHRAELVQAKLVFSRAQSEKTSSEDSVTTAAGLAIAKNNEAKIIFSEAVKRPASGQSAVLYDGEVCVGGGIIE